MWNTIHISGEFSHNIGPIVDPLPNLNDTSERKQSNNFLVFLLSDCGCNRCHGYRSLNASSLNLATRA